MSNVNITEKYALCVLKEKNTLKGNDLTPYLVVSMIVESMLNGNLTIKDKNKVVLKSQQ